MKMGTWELVDVSDGEVLVQTRLLKHPSCSETISVGGTQLQRQGVDLAHVQNPSVGFHEYAKFKVFVTPKAEREATSLAIKHVKSKVECKSRLQVNDDN